ncbi:MAG: HicA toxin of toxin-antitoxin [Candidatus Nitrotoga sp. CP45]|nr:MAG: HicA toxin of toxin-antitoxin [Candidatus Nitrotoga sp. CP45]
MGNIPILRPSEVITTFFKLGFIEIRQRGSHKQFRNSTGESLFFTLPIFMQRRLVLR